MRHGPKPDGCKTCSRRSIWNLLPRLILIAWLIIPLIGCGSSYNPPPIQVDVIAPARPDLTPSLPPPVPIETLPVTWTTIEIAEGTVLVLTPRQFENLSNNLAEILRWIHEAAWRLHYYGATTVE